MARSLSRAVQRFTLSAFVAVTLTGCAKEPLDLDAWTEKLDEPGEDERAVQELGRIRMKVSSATGELVSQQRPLVLPDATRKELLKRAPIIAVTRDAITLNGQLVGDPRVIMNDNSMEFRIIELYDRLGAVKASFRMNGFCTNPKADPTPEETCLDGAVIIQADKETHTKVINRVLKTASDAGFPDVTFVVKQPDTRK